MNNILSKGVNLMGYTAHIRDADKAEQSVISHLCETARLAEGYAEKTGLNNLARLGGLIHDAGKMTNGFNDYIHGIGNKKRGDIDHSYTGARIICEYARKINEPAAYETASLLAHIVISHHGLHDWLKEDGKDYLAERISKNEGYDEAYSEFDKEFGEEIKTLFPLCEEEYSKAREKLKKISRTKKDLAFYLGMFERLMESVLIDADRTDTADFMFDCHTEKEYDTKKLWEDIQKSLEEKLKGFSGNVDKISLQRQSISDRCARFAGHKAGVCRLIVPTGGGKTLSSLRYAVEYCKRFDMDRIFYIAPFMSILEQNSAVIKELCGEGNFLEHHSNILNEMDSEEEYEEYQLRTEKWDIPVIATTLVQFLNALFDGKSSAVRRMHRLCRSVIIIDEVQSVPTKCVNLFNMAINFLTHICGSTVVLCSATQPVFDDTEFPVIYDKERDITGDYLKDFEIFKRTKLVSEVTKEGYSYDDAAEFCYKKYLEHKSLLVVLNTKSSASEIFGIMKKINDNADEENKATMLHISTNMCPKHRKSIIEKAKSLIAEGKRVICVTTQLIEAGVDISFGCAVRSLAGLDNAAQAAGRCNRNGERDEICPVYILYVRDERLGRLKEIEMSQSNSRLLINSKKYDDLLMPEPMEMYFKKLYREAGKELDYNTPDGKDNLMNLLSLDINRWNIRQIKERTYTSQAFKTAGSIFNVIDNNTVGVIVPYDDEAKRMIKKIGSNISLSDFEEAMRKLQSYTVNVYDGMLKKLLNEGAVYQLENGAIVLSERFYDNELGVTLKGTPPEAIIF